MRTPAEGLPRLSSNCLTRATAAGVTPIAAGRGRGARCGAGCGLAPASVGTMSFTSCSAPTCLRSIPFALLLVVGDSRLDRVLGQDRTVDLDRRQREMLRDLGVLDRCRLVDALTLDPFGDERTRSDGRAAAERLELRVLDDPFPGHLDLQLHDVAARRRADQSRADAWIILVERAHIARVLIVVDDFFAVGHSPCSLLTYQYGDPIGSLPVRSVRRPLDRLNVDAFLGHLP